MAVAEHRFRVMASEAHVVVVDAPVGAGDLGARAQAHLEHLERRWSRFLPDSDVARINLAHGRPVQVDPATLTLVATMVSAWHVTGGRFDPTVLPDLVAAGYTSSIEDPNRRTSLPTGRLRTGATGDLHVDWQRGTITAPRGVTVDAGGIGKGLAADLTVDLLLAAGARGALVGLGGDLAMRGAAPEGAGWVVAMEQPDPADGDLCTFTVDVGGVATTSTRSRRWLVDGAARHHVIDPSSHAPATSDLTVVTVVARTGWLAEAHATAALLVGSGHLLDHLTGNGVSGIAVAHDGTTMRTPDLAGLELAVPGTPS